MNEDERDEAQQEMFRQIHEVTIDLLRLALSGNEFTMKGDMDHLGYFIEGFKPLETSVNKLTSMMVELGILEKKE